MTISARNGLTFQTDIDAYWMPFTPNRAFKKAPRVLSHAGGMYYFTPEGRPILDATAGLCCAYAGHCRAPIVNAVRAQVGELDFALSFHFVHPKAFALAGRIAALAPGDLNHVFFTNSGSEAIETCPCRKLNPTGAKPRIGRCSVS